MLMSRAAGRFARIETRQRARALVQGLLASLPSKNYWSLAEHAGDASPDGMQHLLRKAGMPTQSAMTCGTWRCRISAAGRRCWCWMRPAI